MVRRLAVFFLMSWAALLSVFPVSAEDAGPRIMAKVTVTTNFYTVTGSTPREISESKKNARPWKERFSYDGYSEWDVKWTFRYSKRPDETVLDALEITTKVVVTLPRWIPPTNAPPHMVARWRQYILALANHELGHISLARLTTAELEKEFKAVPPAPTPRALNVAVNRLGSQIVEKFRQRDADYDKQTSHGATQGAELRW
ncbi:MAG: DUF922 domain-containing protein [Verrucomicrobia bacterium]|nr:DUF922 domain-containing protein [Verrucomicrobiota bacterium]